MKNSKGTLTGSTANIFNLSPEIERELNKRKLKEGINTQEPKSKPEPTQNNIVAKEAIEEMAGILQTVIKRNPRTWVDAKLCLYPKTAVVFCQVCEEEVMSCSCKIASMDWLDARFDFIGILQDCGYN